MKENESLCISTDVSHIDLTDENGNPVSMPCREVLIYDLDEEVLVSTKGAFDENNVKEGSSLDNAFYCFCDDEKFYHMDAEEFEEYINEEF